MRTLVIGDIHGGLRGLKQVFEKMNLNDDDRFIFVGDYVDGWSENAETVSYLIEFSETYECIFIRGNHDELVYKYLKHGDNNPVWLQHGGELTRESYDRLSSEEKERHIRWYENLMNYYIDEDNRLYLHAGFTNQHGPQNEYYPNMVYWDRTLWEMVCALNPDIAKDDDKYPKRLLLFNEVFIGHTPVTRIGHEKPANFANVWNVDTGAAFKGAVSVMDVETKEVWQSDPVHTLYPDENGRN
ncbi:metallophosphoesterase [Luteirhabdus pelagi]|uniref:metallophosphoesterase n=1 Tax=Luteirhabdus pelagi TaxID=2792783 RepID=UPI00193A6F76|nr:metallophosphoesterase [Luteirhabdus pelagi]